MATTRLRKTKDGKPFYEIRASRKRGETAPTMRWYVPEGWSKRAIDRELAKVAAEFDRQYEAGEIVSKAERKRQEQAKIEAEAKEKTVKQYVEEIYLPHKELSCKPKTVKCYKDTLAVHILPEIGDRKIESIKPTDIDKLLVELQSSDLSFRTISLTDAVIRQVFKMAYMDETITVNPTDRVAKPKRRKDDTKKERDVFTGEQITELLDMLEDEPLHWRAYFNLVAFTGCRRGEALAIKWRNVDMETGRIIIDGGICYTPDKGIFETTPKTGEQRIIYVPADVLSLLTMLREEQKARGIISLYVFPGANAATPMHPDAPNRFMNRLRKRAGITDRLNPHKFRHTFATINIANGANVADVSKALGHADISTTLNIYVHPGEDGAKRSSDLFAEAISRAQ